MEFNTDRNEVEGPFLYVQGPLDIFLYLHSYALARCIEDDEFLNSPEQSGGPDLRADVRG